LCVIITTVGVCAPVRAQDAVLQCAEQLDTAWSRLEADDAAAAVSALALSDSRTCRLLSTSAERHYLTGRIELLQGNVEAAVDALDDARRARSTPRGEHPFDAEILYYLGLAQEAAGHPERAQRRYLELTREHPADNHVALVLPLLESSAAGDAEERLEAALQAIETRNYSAANRLLTRIVTDAVEMPIDSYDERFQGTLRSALDAPGSGTLIEATYQLGYLWYYWIRSENLQAIPLLVAVSWTEHSRSADAAYYLARSYMRDESYDRARNAWQSFADRFPRDRRAHESTYYQGWLHLDREEFEESLPGLLQYLEDYPGGERYDRARWYAGWANYRLGRYTEAREHFLRLQRRGGYLRGAKGRYWEGRCFWEEGRGDEATEAFRDVADRYGFTYYGLLARGRLGEPLVPPREHTPPPSPAERVPELALPGSEISTLVGLVEMDRSYRARRYYDDRRPDTDGDTALDRLFIQQYAGDSYRDWNDARDGRGSALRRVPIADNLMPWFRAYPRPFTHWLESSAEAVEIDPLWIWAHMQIESHYNQGFISYADAQGLLQIIPRTGQHIAAAMGEPYSENMLLDPILNLRYAAWYLDALLDEFNGQLPLAICGYNAGARSIHTWVDQNSDLEYDEFVEEIAYDQAREYLKKVTGMYASYLYLYADDALLEVTIERLLPERIEPGYRAELDW
jgi:soluble lytic murein transglycosylase-like protein